MTTAGCCDHDVSENLCFAILVSPHRQPSRGVLKMDQLVSSKPPRFTWDALGLTINSKRAAADRQRFLDALQQIEKSILTNAPGLDSAEVSRNHFLLSKEWKYLNHGSYGAVLAEAQLMQRAFQDLMVSCTYCSDCT